MSLDEEALEEVEFFASHGMFEEAKNLLDEQISRLPTHPLLLERKREIESLAGGAPADGSGTRAVPRAAMPGEDRSFGLEAEHYESSVKMGELALLPAVRSAF